MKWNGYWAENFYRDFSMENGFWLSENERLVGGKNSETHGFVAEKNFGNNSIVYREKIFKKKL